MSNIKLVIVPAWLNLIMRELGITNDDLANCEKLSGILSPRDLLIYKLANLRAGEIFTRLFEGDQNLSAEMLTDYDNALPRLSLEETSQVSYMTTDHLIYGVSAHRMKEDPLLCDVELTDTELLVIKLVPHRYAADTLKDCRESLAAKLTRIMYGRIPLVEVAALGSFKQYVGEIQINSTLY